MKAALTLAVCLVAVVFGLLGLVLDGLYSLFAFVFFWALVLYPDSRSLALEYWREQDTLAKRIGALLEGAIIVGFGLVIPSLFLYRLLSKALE